MIQLIRNYVHHNLKDEPDIDFKTVDRVVSLLYSACQKMDVHIDANNMVVHSFDASPYTINGYMVYHVDMSLVLPPGDWLSFEPQAPKSVTLPSSLLSQKIDLTRWATINMKSSLDQVSND